MRIALYGREALGVRIARVLLAERHLERLGIVEEDVRHPKVERVESVDDYDAVIITELDEDGIGLMHEAIERRVDVVLGHEAPRLEAPASAVIPGLLSPRALANALAVSTRERVDEAVEVTIAWTAEGRLLRRGDAVTFPEPIGARWAEPNETLEDGIHRALEAPGPPPWAGALARVTTMTASGLRTTTTAAVDDQEFMAAAMLAGAAIAAAEGAYGAGVSPAGDAGGAFMRAVQRAGIEAAIFTRA
jgi:hypothetical protein